MGGYKGGLSFEVNNNGIANNTGTTQAMRIDNTGNVLVDIGTMTITSLNT